MDDIFMLFSISKSMNAALVLNRVERGDFLLTTPVAELIPEFATNGKSEIAVHHLLSHTGGMPVHLPLELQGNLAANVEYICRLPPARPIGVPCYSPAAGHYVLAELVRRAEGSGRAYWEIMRDELFRPLGMTGASLGQEPGREPRVVPVAAKGVNEGIFPAAYINSIVDRLRDHAEVPGGGVFATVEDVWKFGEMLRRGGELDGARILSPAMIRLATKIQTGEAVFDELYYASVTRNWTPAPFNAALGFVVRGAKPIHLSQTGLLASPGTFGHKGAGTTNYWVDPESQITFACLTVGFLEESRSWERWQRLSDMVHASVVAPIS